MSSHRPRRPHIGAAFLLAAAASAIPGIGVGQELSAGCLPAGAAEPAPIEAAPTPTPAPGPVTISVTDTAGNALSVTEVTTGSGPSGIAVDASDPFGRVFVADQGSDQVTVLYGRSPALTMGCRLPVGSQPIDVAVDDATGIVLATLGGAPRVVLIEGRSEPPRIIGWVDLPGIPSQVVVDQAHRRAWVTLPEEGQIARLDANGPGDPADLPWRLTGTFDAGSYPTFLAVDRERGRLFVSAQGQPTSAQGDQGAGAVLTFDTSADALTLMGEPIPASVPTGITVDHATGTAYVLENGTDELLSIVLANDDPVREQRSAPRACAPTPCARPDRRGPLIAPFTLGEAPDVG